MILITGGAYQGKKEYVLQNFSIEGPELVEGRCAAMDSTFQGKGILYLEQFIKTKLELKLELEEEFFSQEKAQSSILKEIKEIINEVPELIIVVTELGCGVVPYEYRDRVYREVTGRISCELAKSAEMVIRVISGIGMVLKHD